MGIEDLFASEAIPFAGASPALPTIWVLYGRVGAWLSGNRRPT